VNHEPKWWCISVEGIKMEDLLQFNPSITNQCDIFGNCTTMRSKRLSSEKSVIQCILNISNDCRANQFLKQRKVESCKRCKNILRKTQGNEPNIPFIRIYSVFRTIFRKFNELKFKYIRKGLIIIAGALYFALLLQTILMNSIRSSKIIIWQKYTHYF
jgi:hypothetical protein